MHTPQQQWHNGTVFTETATATATDTERWKPGVTEVTVKVSSATPDLLLIQ